MSIVGLLIMVIAILVVAVVCLSYEVLRLRGVLKPFATFGVTNVDKEGWNELGVSTKNERIVDWFGPSDFRNAVDAFGADAAKAAAE